MENETASLRTAMLLLEHPSASEHGIGAIYLRRWMTWRLLEGWQYGKVRDPMLKHHPDIVPYEHLAKSTQEKDKAIIRAIPKLLGIGRLRISRIDPLSLIHI